MFNGFNMGPRGRGFGHRGFRPGIFAGIIGLIFFGPAILAIVFSLVGAGAMVLYSVVSGLAQIAPRLFSGIFSSGGFAVGLAIGLLLSIRNHRKNTAPEAEREETGNGETENAPAEEIIEAPRYRTF